MASYLSAATDSQFTTLVLPVAGLVMVITIFAGIWATRFTKVGPDSVLVVSGRRHVLRDADGKTHTTGYRIVKGGGTFVVPVVEQAAVLSLAPISLDLALTGISILNGGMAEVVAKAQVRIRSDDTSLARAVETLLGKSPEQVKDIAGQLMESSVRLLLASRTATELHQNQSELAGQWQEAAKPGLADLGLDLLSLSVRGVGVNAG